MRQEAATGFTLWLRTARGTSAAAPVAARIRDELLALGIGVELVDAAALARETYRRKISGQGMALAVAMTAKVLNNHGIACVIFGARGAAADFAWKNRRPEHLLDVVCAKPGVTVSGKGPYLLIRPYDPASKAGPPDPPRAARVDDDEPHPGSAESSPGPAESPDAALDPQPEWDLRPLLDALHKAGWITAPAAGHNSDDALIRQRLKDLGYL